MRKPTKCLGENKGADQLCAVAAQLISAFVLGETGASWSENCIVPMSDFNVNLLLLV